MIWILFSLLTAFSRSVFEVFWKNNLKKHDEYIMWLWTRIYSTILILPFLLYEWIPEIKSGFWLALIISWIINSITTTLAFKAYKSSDLSLVSPISTLTPFFLVFTSPFIIWEMPDNTGLIWVFIILLWSYLLKIKHIKDWLFAPIKAIFKEEWVRYMLIVAFLWSISSIYDKVWIQSSSIFFWMTSINIFTVLFPISMTKKETRKNRFPEIIKYWKDFLTVSFFWTIWFFFQLLALKTTLVIYVVSIKRTSSIFSVILSWIFLKEKWMKERLSWVVVMAIGIIVIVISQMWLKT